MTAPDPGWGVTEGQYRYLTLGINEDRVRTLQGNSHLEAWDVRRTLIRVFGFGGFDIETRNETLVKEIEHPPGSIKKIDFKAKRETSNDNTQWTVVYRVGLRLVIKDPQGRPIAHFDDAATGDAANQPSIGDAHDLALKTAHSQALKRCAVNLGDQFGLSLYNKGRPEGVVVRSLVSPVRDEPAPTPDDAPAVLGGELDGPDVHDDEDYGPVTGQGAEPVTQPEPVQDQPARNDPGPAQAAVLLVKAALQAARREQLLGILSQAKTQNLLKVDVASVIEPAHAAFLGFMEPPVTLQQWVTACGKYVNESGGKSVYQAAKAADSSEGVPQ